MSSAVIVAPSSWRGEFPGGRREIARQSGRGRNPGQAPVAAEQQAGRDARMPAFTGLTGDLCYAVPPLATAECAWRRALIHWRSLIGVDVAVTRAVPAGGGRAVGGREVFMGKSAPFRCVGGWKIDGIGEGSGWPWGFQVVGATA